MNFTILPYDLEQIGRAGHGTINCKIQGYWSSNPITLYVDRGFYGPDRGWKVTLSHSSGGRDPKEVESDMEAAINFADAMRELAIIGRDLIFTYGDTLESFFQAECEVRRAQDEAEKVALAAKVEADPAMGDLAASDIVARMAAGRLPSSMSFYKRGSDVQSVMVSVQIRHKTKFYVDGQSSAKKDVIALLAGLSARENVSVRS
jgi:hypothetical protein